MFATTDVIEPMRPEKTKPPMICAKMAYILWRASEKPGSWTLWGGLELWSVR